MGFDEDYNFIPFFGVVIVVLWVMWVAFSNIDVGMTYILMFLTGTALFFWLLIFVKEKQFVKRLKLPFTTSTPGGAALFLLGWIFLSVINIVGLLIKSKGVSFSIDQFWVPLAASKVNILIQQSAQQLSIVTSNAAQLFTTVMVASYIEEILFALVFIHISYRLIRVIFKEALSINLSHKQALGLSFVVVSFMFAFAHSLNGSYESFGMYIVSAIFRTVLNAIIYYAGASLSFVIGLHQANNFWWFVKQYGWSTTINAMSSIAGIIIVAQFVLCAIIVFNKFPSANKAVAKVWRDLQRRGG